MKKLLFSVLLLGGSLLSLHADIIPTLNSVTPNGNGTFTWDYTANVTLDQRVQTGNFFTIYDFGNIVPGSNTQPAGWTFSSSLVGTTPSMVNATDNPAVLNLTWTYAAGATITGPAPLGEFTVTTTTNQSITGQFAAEATRSTGPQIGTKIDNIGNVTVPVPEMPALMPILALGVGSIATAVWRRRALA